MMSRKLILTCMVAAWVATVAGQSAATGSSPQVLLQGRFSPGSSSNGVASLPQLMSWAASSVYVSFEGATSVSVNIAALPQNGSISYAINWFRFFLDDAFAADGFTSYNQLNLGVTLNVAAGTHQLRIAKMNDGSKGEALIQSITLSQGGRFLPPSPPSTVTSSRKILFLGDSYSVGYGNAGAVLPDTCKPTVAQLRPEWSQTCTGLKITAASECADLWQVLNQNSLAAFTAVTAQAFGADYQVIAASGSGMVGYSYAADSHPDLSPAEYEAILPSNQALFPRSDQSDSAPKYTLSSWIPQVVVVSSGTNDWHSVPPLYSLDDWIQKAIAFLKEVSATFNQPTIVLQAWPEEQQLAGALNGENGINETMQYVEAMPALFSEAVEAGVPNIHYLQLETNNYDNLYSWCDGHPSAVADRAIAQQLTKFIGSVVPSWSNFTAVNTTVDQVAIRPSTALYSTTGSPPVQAAVTSAG